MSNIINSPSHYTDGCTDRIQAFAFIALRDLYGFGKKRLSVSRKD